MRLTDGAMLLALGLVLACGDDVSATAEGSGESSGGLPDDTTTGGRDASSGGSDTSTTDATVTTVTETSSPGSSAADTSSSGPDDSTGSEESSSEGSSSGNPPQSCGVPPAESDAFCGDDQHCDDDVCVDDLPVDASCDEQSDCASGWCAADVCRAAGPYPRLGTTFLNVTLLVNEDGSVSNWGRATDVDELDVPGQVVQADGDCLLDDEGNATCLGFNGAIETGSGFHQFESSSSDCGIVDEGSIACVGNLPFKGLPVGDDFTQVAVGNHVNACGLHADGSISCSDPNPGWASMYAGPFDFIDVHGSITLCGLRPDASLMCAHQNGVTVSEVELEGPFVDVEGDFFHFCAVRDTGEVICQRMDGSPLSFLEDTPDGTYTEVVVDGFRACALDVDGTVDCWGSTSPASYGQTDDFPRPAAVLAPSSECRIIALDPDGTMSPYAGCSDFSLDSLDVPGSFEEVHAVSDVLCGRRDDGHGVCWSDAWPDTMDFGPVQHICGGTLSPVQDDPYACWIDADDGVVCSDSSGADAVWSAPPTADAESIECGDGFACALLQGGAVECWGTASATPDPGDDTFATLTCAEDMCCGTLLDGTPTCFDDVGLSLPGTYAEVCVGEDVLCGRTEDGAIDCDFAPLDDVTAQPTPVADDFVDLGCGRASACGVAEGGAIECWGRAEVSR